MSRRHRPTSRAETPAETVDGFYLFSPSSSYPRPFACLIDRGARLVHAWSSTLDQPVPASHPPTYLRGWNHVELDERGNLFATVPLRSLLKLAPDSRVLWRAEVAAHHDLDIAPDGTVHVLTESVRLVPWSGGTHVLLDADVTVLDPDDGHTLATHSIYDILTTGPHLQGLVDAEIRRRRAAGPPAAGILDPVVAAEAPDPASPLRDVLSRLRDAPGSPSDVLHANTLEVLRDPHAGPWQAGQVLVSLRNLDLLAVLDLQQRRVIWWWGPGELSGQHQPSVLETGTVLVFDNGRRPGRSRVVEVDPMTGAILWQYTADPPEALFVPVAGGCQMLGNHNILIADSPAGRAFEVTRDGEIVWGVHVARLHTGNTTSRAGIYRMTAVHPDVIERAGLAGGAVTRTLITGRRFTCSLDQVMTRSGTATA